MWESVCCVLLCVHSSFAIILMGTRELVCLQFVIVVFSDHSHLLFPLYRAIVVELFGV